MSDAPDYKATAYSRDCARGFQSKAGDEKYGKRPWDDEDIIKDLEAQLKSKDVEIERLRAELKEAKTQLKWLRDGYDD